MRIENEIRSSLRLVVILLSTAALAAICEAEQPPGTIVSIAGSEPAKEGGIWLTHEHILVDFIGAEHIDPANWNHKNVLEAMAPNIEEIKKHNVRYFVDCTPNYIGRDVVLLEKIAKRYDLKIVTNTGLYGARNKKFVPEFALKLSAEELANIWIGEFENGIDDTGIKPGFIKIGVDNNDPLDPIDQRLVAAACITHLKTGLTIASHTGEAAGMWPQLKILEHHGVAPSAFIWVHAHNEADNVHYLRAAEAGCWISLDGLGWETEQHIEKLIFAKANNILNRILISHDAGWYDPQKKTQDIKPYTNLFEVVIPSLKKHGFTQDDIDLLLVKNPVAAFAIRKRTR